MYRRHIHHICHSHTHTLTRTHARTDLEGRGAVGQDIDHIGGLLLKGRRELLIVRKCIQHHSEPVHSLYICIYIYIDIHIAHMRTHADVDADLFGKKKDAKKKQPKSVEKKGEKKRNRSQASIYAASMSQ
jgi:hypothetical protein